MARRRTASVTVEPRVLIVTGWQVGNVLAAEGLKPIYVGTVKGWMLDRRHLSDVLSILQYHRIEANVIEDGDAA